MAVRNYCCGNNNNNRFCFNHLTELVSEKLTEYAGTSFKLHIIIALDPASPLFTKNTRHCLGARAAKFVEAWITSIIFFGMKLRVATSSLVFNRGRDQFALPDLSGMRSHSAAWLYFAITIISDEVFVGFKCASLEHAMQERYDRDRAPRIIIDGDPHKRVRYVDIVSNAMTRQTKSLFLIAANTSLFILWEKNR